jgi:hypothetical protein
LETSCCIGVHISWCHGLLCLLACQHYYQITSDFDIVTEEFAIVVILEFELNNSFLLSFSILMLNSRYHTYAFHACRALYIVKANFNNSIHILRPILLFVYLSKNTYFIYLLLSPTIIPILTLISIKYYFSFHFTNPVPLSLSLPHIKLERKLIFMYPLPQSLK